MERESRTSAARKITACETATSSLLPGSVAELNFTIRRLRSVSSQLLFFRHRDTRSRHVHLDLLAKLEKTKKLIFRHVCKNVFFFIQGTFAKSVKSPVRLRRKNNTQTRNLRTQERGALERKNIPTSTLSHQQGKPNQVNTRSSSGRRHFSCLNFFPNQRREYDLCNAQNFCWSSNRFSWAPKTTLRSRARRSMSKNHALLDPTRKPGRATFQNVENFPNPSPRGVSHFNLFTSQHAQR